MRTILIALALPLLASCAGAPPAATAASTHDGWLAAINSNDVDRILEWFTDDCVVLAPGQQPMIGKAPLRPWVQGYVDAFATRWDKQLIELVSCGEWAFERYRYTHVDTPRAGGAPIRGQGWGLVVWHHDADGRWRVARDAWGVYED
ncbi:MAG: nuclear transport factor 2 family protein [Planctomycetes bacterium]|nr:nuclear transport factor 2 family protein [Planctomycetota bacterium]